MKHIFIILCAGASLFTLAWSFQAGQPESPLVFSLSLIDEAKRILPEIEKADAAKELTEELGKTEKFLIALKQAKAEGAAPLLAYMAQRTERGFPANDPSVRMPLAGFLCVVDASAVAEQLALQITWDSYPLWRVGRYHMDHGNRAEAIRVFKLAAAKTPLPEAPTSPAQFHNPNSQPLLAGFLKANDIAGAVEVVESIQLPAARATSLIFIARHCVTAGNKTQASDLLGKAEKLLVLPPDPPRPPNDPTVPLWLVHLSIEYSDVDPTRSSPVADIAIDQLGKIQDPQNTALKVAARCFWASEDRKHAGAVIDLMRLRAATPTGGARNYMLWDLGMLQAQLGGYAGSVVTLTPKGMAVAPELARAMQDGRLPENAAEAKAFLKAYRNAPTSEVGILGSSRAKMIRVLVMAGEVDEARKLADTGPRLAKLMYTVIAGQLAADNHLVEAEKELASLDEGPLRGQAIAAMVKGLLARNDLDNAVRLLDSQPSIKIVGIDSVYAHAAIACMKARRFSDATRFGAQADAYSQDQLIRELCRCDRLDDAVKLARGGAHNRTANTHGWFIAEAWARQDRPDKVMEAVDATFGSNENGCVNGIAPKAARLWCTQADAAKVAAWARSLKSPTDRCATLLAIARTSFVEADVVARERREYGTLHPIPLAELR